MSDSDYTGIMSILQERFGDLSCVRDGVFIAGQAVASAWFVYKNLPVRGPMKDLDVFELVDSVNELDLLNKVPINSKRHGVVSHYPALDPSFDMMDRSVYAYPVWKNGYRVMASGMEENINRVLIKASFDVTDEIPFTAYHLIDSFDVNCAAIALDTKNQTVVRHPEFDEFCRTRQLKAMSYYTPASTALRIIAKSVAIEGCYFDETKELSKIQLVLAASLPGGNYYTPPYSVGSGVSARRFNAIPVPFMDRLLRYFVFTSVRIQLINGIVMDLVRFDVPETLIEPSLEPSVRAIRNVMTVCIDERASIYGLQPFLDLHYSRLGSLAERLLSLNDRGDKFAYLTWMFCFPRVPLEHIRLSQFIRLCSKHPVVMRMFNYCTASEVNSLIQRLVWADNHYRALFGMLETGDIMACDFDTLFPTLEEMRSHKEAYYRDLGEQNVEPCLAPYIDGEVRVSEITNALALHDHGERQMHCVGGYWDSIVNGFSMVFVMQSQAGCSTVEIRYKRMDDNLFTRGRYVVAQNYAARNSDPPSEHKECEAGLIRRLDALTSTRLQNAHRKPLIEVLHNLVMALFGRKHFPSFRAQKGYQQLPDPEIPF